VDPLSLVVLTLLGRYLVTRLQWFVGLHRTDAIVCLPVLI